MLRWRNLVDAPGLEPGGFYPWGFESPSQHRFKIFILQKFPEFQFLNFLLFSLLKKAI